MTRVLTDFCEKDCPVPFLGQAAQNGGHMRPAVYMVCVIRGGGSKKVKIAVEESTQKSAGDLMVQEYSRYLRHVASTAVASQLVC